MTNPLVSIIVPVYNAQKGLSRCLESICSQTYQELEIIVLNDGSTDDSLAICEQFRAEDPRIVVVDKENEGVSRTRNAGLTLAQGDYIQFADGLPKTRSGKIMRRILRKIAEGDFNNFGDTTTLLNPEIVDEIKNERIS